MSELCLPVVPSAARTATDWQPHNRPQSRDDFEIAIVCALPLEFDAVSCLVDNFYDDAGDPYGRAQGDTNSYVTGRIGNHPVVITLLPGTGKVHAANSVARLESSYVNLKLVLLVGICGGVPILNNGEEILLGDVVIGDAVVQYDFGRRYPDSFVSKDITSTNSGRSYGNVNSLLATFRTQLGMERLQQRTAYFLGLAQNAASYKHFHGRYKYPGATQDRLFARDDRHRHHNSQSCICSEWKELSDPVCERASNSLCAELGCSSTVPRRRLDLRLTLERAGGHSDLQQPLVFLGRIASGDTVMKSGSDRDKLAEELNVIAFEMEGSGIWVGSPCIVIKGVCDYADSHKDKIWQEFAAATAAAAAKALLERYAQTDRSALHQKPLPLSENHWRTTLVSSAMANLPFPLYCHLVNSFDSSALSTEWKASISQFIISRPRVPLWLSNTSPYKRWATGAERSICYEVPDLEDGADDMRGTEHDDILLSFLGEFEETEKRHGAKRTKSRPKVLKNLYLFYTLTNHAQRTDNQLDLLPHQTFLWSLISQTLLWRFQSTSLLLGWLGALNPGQSSLQTLPDFEQLRKFFCSVLELSGTPVVITICHAELLLDEHHLPVLQMLYDICRGIARLNVSVYILLNIPEGSSSLSVIEDFPKVSRHTEGNECLNHLKFEGQFLRRDEVSIADEGTNRWIWTHPAYVDWERRPCGILWIEGKAGSGKSVLAKTIQLRLQGLRQRSKLRGVSLPPVSDWFYSSRHGTTMKSHVAFLRSTLSQLLEQNADSFQHYAAVYRQMRQENKSWEMDDYENVLEMLAGHSTPAICIVDAMDESESGGDTFELRSRIIHLMSRLTRAPGSRIRFVVLSRYTVDIDQALRSCWKRGEHLSHIILEQENQGDIIKIADNGLDVVKRAMDSLDSDDEMLENFSPSFPASHDDEFQVLGRIRDHVIENAEGVILWVKLAVQSLMVRVQSGLYTLQELEADVKSLPRDLVEFYKLILSDLVMRYSPAELDKSKMCLMWVVGASAIRPLALDELFEAISIPTEPTPPILAEQDPITHSQQRVWARSWIGFYRQLRLRCGPFLEILIPSKLGASSSFHENTAISPRFTIQLLHRTVKDFLHDPTKSGALSFTERDAEDLVQKSIRTYVDLVLPVDQTNYCPVPAKQSSDVETTVCRMTEYLNGKVLLEFALELIPEEELIYHLLIFELSVHPPLPQQREQMPWDPSLYSIAKGYFQYGCDMALNTAVANLLCVASILLLNWPTLLRYGPLMRAISSIVHEHGDLLQSEDVPTALAMIEAFYRRDISMTWDCSGFMPGEEATVTMPTVNDFREVIRSFEISHGFQKRNGK